VIRPTHLRERCVDPQLEVVAAGHVEGLLIANFATPERDSLLELLPATHPAFEIGKQIYKINGDQTDQAKTVLGVLDSLAVDLERDRVNPVKQSIGVKALAKALRPHLAVVVKSDGRLTAEVMLAIKQVTRITDQASLEHVLAPGLARDLGEKKTRALRDIVGKPVQS
jgi:hypothetical protein